MRSVVETCCSNLTANGFDAFIADNCQQAEKIFFEQIAPQISFKSVSWGDSITMNSTGVLQKLEKQKDIEIIKFFERLMKNTCLVAITKWST